MCLAVCYVTHNNHPVFIMRTTSRRWHHMIMGIASGFTDSVHSPAQTHWLHLGWNEDRSIFCGRQHSLQELAMQLLASHKHLAFKGVCSLRRGVPIGHTLVQDMDNEHKVSHLMEPFTLLDLRRLLSLWFG